MKKEKIQCEASTGTKVLNNCLNKAYGQYELQIKKQNGEPYKANFCKIHGKGKKLIKEL